MKTPEESLVSEPAEGSRGEYPGAFKRLRLAVGDDGLDRLNGARVAVIGLGAVGSFATEALARSGVGYLRLVDFDVIQPSNINRQLFALSSTVGKSKADVAKARVLDIFPGCRVDIRKEFFCSDTAALILDQPVDEPLDYVIDAIDSLHSKVTLIAECVTRGIPIVSSMGAADRMDPSAVHVTDIGKSYNCPLAKHVRKRLHRRGIFDGVTAVWSSEPPCHGGAVDKDIADSDVPEDDGVHRGRERAPLPSTAPLPGMFGLAAAGWVIRNCAGTTRVG